MFIDETVIYVRSGKGGDGMMHFRREKFVPHGGPDGGDGGRGGDVVLEVLPTLNTLSMFRHKEKFIAEDGAKGFISNQTGKSAPDLIVHVPPGTVVYDANTGAIMGDLTEPHQQLVVCKGGKGGRGNPHFVNSRIQAPRNAEKGEPAEEKNLRFELKLIADVGLIGVPNAGKSSLLAAVTNAKPKIAPYPFTTIEPNLGVADLDDDTSLVLADIPGLIEGAHEGVGLGYAFLRHIQRTRVLIHILDGMAEDPLADFSQINSELSLFDPRLSEKPQVVAFNKMDLPDVQERWPAMEAEMKKRGYDVYPISAVTGLNVRQLLWRASELLAQAPEAEPVVEMPVYRPKEEEELRNFTVTRTEEGFEVKGKAIERAASMTFWEYEGSVRRFQRLMSTIGVEDALREAGVEEGDTVCIGDYELEWQE